jgi:7,8-dihydropterin-6-yl-methyl-4-(beta-D-ribofuranosyl)aminobenzene 5'-phosphate synthase
MIEPMPAVAVTRRAVIVGGAGLMLMGQSAPGLPLMPVDHLAITFLVDGAVSSFAEPVRTETFAVERPSRLRTDYRQRLLAEWGLSLLIESQTGRERRTVLMDFGYSPDVLLNNARLLETDFGAVDTLVLSHGHYDHFGGLAGLIATGAIRRGTPLLVGGEEALCHRLRGGPGSTLSFGAVDREALQRAGVDLRLAARPERVGHGLTTGQIPLAIEHPRTPSTMEPGHNCDRALLDPDKRSLDRVQDDSRHELGLAFNVRGAGLVVLGACSHRGILNTVAAAQRATGVDRVHAIVGGFHLVAPQTRQDAIRTADAMRKLGPALIVPGHCSGEWFIEAASAALPGRIVRPYVGTRLIFGNQG